VVHENGAFRKSKRHELHVISTRRWKVNVRGARRRRNSTKPDGKTMLRSVTWYVVFHTKNSVKVCL
jgi:hypothetical protein